MFEREQEYLARLRDAITALQAVHAPLNSSAELS
jgi:hypothetical protein